MNYELISKSEIHSEIDNYLKGHSNESKFGFFTNEDSGNPTIKHGYKSLSEFAKDVALTTINGHPSNKLVEYNARVKDAGDPSHIEGASDLGGFLIPDEFSQQLLRVATDQSQIMPRCMKVPMGTNAIDIPYINGFDRSGGLLHGNVQMLWTSELEQMTAKNIKFGKIHLELDNLIGFAYASDQLLEDSPMTMEPILRAGFSDAMTWTLDWAFLNGSGAGQPLGILNSGCLIEVSAETGQAADTIVYENIVKMYARLWRKQNAVWIANPDTFPQLATMTLAVGAGGVPVYMPAGAASGKPYDTLMGLPLIFSEHCQTLGDKGDIFLCDWSQYLVGMKSSDAVKWQSSIHLKFDYNQTAFRLVSRIAAQPWWAMPMTPRYSSDELSPFICLAAR